MPPKVSSSDLRNILTILELLRRNGTLLISFRKSVGYTKDTALETMGLE